MKNLRKTIRTILLENTNYYNKIIDGILSKDPENINQFLELAEGMEYIESLMHDRYPVKDPNWPKRKAFASASLRWEFYAIPDFAELLLKKREEVDCNAWGRQTGNFKVRVVPNSTNDNGMVKVTIRDSEFAYGR